MQLLFLDLKGRMGKDNKLNNIAWFVNPYFDLVFLAGFPIGLMITALPVLSFPSYYLKFIIYVDALTNFPHMFAGFTTGYALQKEWQRKPIAFVVIPLIIFVATIIFSIYGYFTQIYLIRTLWGSYHIFDQNRFILNIHKALNNDFQKIDRMLDSPAMMVVTFLSAFWLFIDKRFFNFLMFLAWFVVVIFVVRQIYLFIRKKSSSQLFKTSMISSFASAFYYPAIITKNAFSAIRAGITTHNLQYLAWNWSYFRKSLAEGKIKKTQDVALLSRPAIFVLIFMLIGLICLWHVRTSIQTKEGSFIVGVFYTAFAFVHFFLDPFVWKASRNTMLTRN